jgi:hypothetical protein
VLPAPVALLGLIPAYRTHAQLLLVFTPIVCLLTAAYLFYIRDYLARLMFGKLLLQAPPDPYYYYRRRSFGERLGRGARRVWPALVAFLPVMLLCLSVYCLTRYTSLLNQSLALAGDSSGNPAAPTDDVGFVGGQPIPGGYVRPKRNPQLPVDGAADRTRLLHSSAIDRIPLFGELTVFYVGGFVAACVALSLMALKEHARLVIGLTERELMLGRAVQRSD